MVTGADRGIGRSIALALAEAGAAVAVHHLEDDGQAQLVAEACGPSATTLRADLADREQVERLVAEAQAWRPIDILVLNASFEQAAKLEERDDEIFDRQVEVNLRSCHRLMAALAPTMASRGWGRIVAIGSVYAHKPSPGLATYAATKAALVHLCRSFARRYSREGVTVNSLSPGVIETGRTAPFLNGEGNRERMEQWIPAGRVGLPDDCAGAALLLCSDAGAYITASDLLVDGGLRQ